MADLELWREAEVLEVTDGGEKYGENLDQRGKTGHLILMRFAADSVWVTVRKFPTVLLAEVERTNTVFTYAEGENVSVEGLIKREEQIETLSLTLRLKREQAKGIKHCPLKDVSPVWRPLISDHPSIHLFTTQHTLFWGCREWSELSVGSPQTCELLTERLEPGASLWGDNDNHHTNVLQQEQ